MGNTSSSRHSRHSHSRVSLTSPTSPINEANPGSKALVSDNASIPMPERRTPDFPDSPNGHSHGHGLGHKLGHASFTFGNGPISQTLAKIMPGEMSSRQVSQVEKGERSGESSGSLPATGLDAGRASQEQLDREGSEGAVLKKSPVGGTSENGAMQSMLENAVEKDTVVGAPVGEYGPEVGGERSAWGEHGDQDVEQERNAEEAGADGVEAEAQRPEEEVQDELEGQEAGVVTENEETAEREMPGGEAVFRENDEDTVEEKRGSVAPVESQQKVDISTLPVEEEQDISDQEHRATSDEDIPVPHGPFEPVDAEPEPELEHNVESLDIFSPTHHESLVDDDRRSLHSLLSHSPVSSSSIHLFPNLHPEPTAEIVEHAPVAPTAPTPAAPITPPIARSPSPPSHIVHPLLRPVHRREDTIYYPAEPELHVDSVMEVMEEITPPLAVGLLPASPERTARSASPSPSPAPVSRHSLTPIEPSPKPRIEQSFQFGGESQLPSPTSSVIDVPPPSQRESELLLLAGKGALSPPLQRTPSHTTPVVERPPSPLSHYLEQHPSQSVVVEEFGQKKPVADYIYHQQPPSPSLSRSASERSSLSPVPPIQESLPSPPPTGKPEIGPEEPEEPERQEMGTLDAGVYFVSDERWDTSVDLSGGDHRSAIAFSYHGGDNQQWEFVPLGAGYAIQSLKNSTWLTVEGKIEEEAAIVSSKFPVSWDVEVVESSEEEEDVVVKIHWPNSNLLFGLADTKLGTQVRLTTTTRHDISKCWRLRPRTSSGHVVSSFETKQERRDGDAMTMTTTTTTTTVKTVTRVMRKLATY